MKRLVLFVSIFGVGLLILVFALGPSRLWRRPATSSIQPQDLPPAPNAISLSTQGQRVSLGMRGAGTIPFWTAILQPDGASLRVKAAQLKYADNEPYPGGVHLIQPLLELYPAKATDEKAMARVTAAGGDLATRGDLRSLAESLKTQELREFALSPDVRLEWFDPDGNPGLAIETSRLEIPETPLGVEDEAPPPFPKLVAPKPVHVFAADGGFNLNAAGLELWRLDGRLVLHGPLTLTATHFALPVAGAPAPTAKPADQLKPADHSKPAASAPSRPPVTLTCDGGATFVRKALEKGAAATVAARAPAQVIGPGTLVFVRNVVVRQTDPLTNDERWLRTERLELELENDANGQLTVTHFDAGSAADADGQVTFGLLGGEGSARTLTREGDGLVARGPVRVDGLHVGAGKEARTFSLAAQERLVVREEPATGDGPARWRAELFGAAHATSQDELDSDADQITAVLVKLADGASPAGDPQKGGGSFGLDQLDLDGHAKIDLHARGHANAQKITLRNGRGGGRVAHLEGDAVGTTDRGTLRGPTLDLDLPASKELPLHATAPVLTDGRMVLPAGASLFDEQGAFGAKTGAAKPAVAGEKPASPRELRLEPVAPTRFEIVGDEIHLRGCTTVRIFELPGEGGEGGERETQRVTADSLDLLPRSGGTGADATPASLVADGNVDVVDVERNFHLQASHAHTELSADGHRHLVLEGAPAKGTVDVALAQWPKGKTAELTLVSSHLDFDLDTHRIVADDPEHQVTAWIPEALVGTMLPSGFGVLERTGAAAGAAAGDGGPPAAELPPLEFHADHVEVTPQDPGDLPKPPKAADPSHLPTALAATATSDNPFAHARVDARGHLHALRKSDDSTFDAETMVLDLAASRARLDGGPGAPVKLLRPKPYAKERVEQVISDWIEATNGGERVKLAARRDGPVIVLFPEKEPQDGKLPKRTRVELHCSEPPELIGNRLLMSGGVDTWLEIGQSKAHARSERVEVLLSGPLGARDLTLLRLNAQERVRLDFGDDLGGDTPVGDALRTADYHAEGARLTYDFASGELVLKQGVEPCRLLSADAQGEWHSTATFGLMTGNLIQFDADHAARSRSRANLLAWEIPRFKFRDFQLVAEGPRER